MIRAAESVAISSSRPFATSKRQLTETPYGNERALGKTSPWVPSSFATAYRHQMDKSYLNLGIPRWHIEPRGEHLLLVDDKIRPREPANQYQVIARCCYPMGGSGNPCRFRVEEPSPPCVMYVARTPATPFLATIPHS